MRRFGVRLAMALVGVALLTAYLAAAYVGFLGVRWLWLNRPGLPTLAAIVAGVTVVSAYLSYRLGTRQLLAALEANRLHRDAAPGVHRRVDELARRMNVGRPDLFVVAMRAPNALALGSAERGAVVLDRSLFRLLSPAELEGIVAHELAHLESNDTVSDALAHGIGRTVVGVISVLLLPAVLALSGLARGSAWIRGSPRDRTGTFARLRRGLVGGLVMLFVASTLLVRARSRRREFAADDRAVDVTGDPLALARAIRKIERAQGPTWMLSPLSTNRETDTTLERLLSTHPPTTERVERLVQRARAESARREGSRPRRPTRVPLEFE